MIGSMNFGNLDFSRKMKIFFHNNIWARCLWSVKFCRRKTVEVYVYYGQPLDSKRSCFGNLVFNDAGNGIVIQSVIISTPHALQAYDDRIGHHRPAMRAESL